jgi:threonine dehydratase
LFFHMKPFPLTLETVQQAQARVAGGLRLTPCAYSTPLSEITGMSIFFKRDYEQATGSFKERGARNALLMLSPDERVRGVVAASAGNHALGLAYHGRLLGISVTVVMPRTAPRIKAERCRELGARVILHGGGFAEAADFALRLGREEHRTFIHPFEDDAVIAGQGTLALEVLDQVPDFDAWVVPVGGGGLLAGVATVVKMARPGAEIIAVEPAHAAGLTVALSAGRPVQVPVSPTLADGLAVAQVGDNTFALAHDRVDRCVTVTEDEIAVALFELAEREGTIVEGAAAAGLAACLSGKLSHLQGKRVIIPLGGRNIDPAVHARALWRGQATREFEARDAVVRGALGL